jgi:hypothetical protein
MTGEIKRVSYEIKDGRTIVPLHFAPWDAYFIVFKDKASVRSFAVPEIIENQLLTYAGPWQVTFESDLEALVTADFKELKSWTENDDQQIKYFSGTAVYKATFESPVAGSAKLELGDVKNIAEVIVNGKPEGIVWKAPFSIELKNPLKRGKNTLEIRVTNVWVNRLIGDVQPGVTKKIGYTSMPFYQANSPLLPSGLLGPVIFKSLKKK